MNLTTIFSFCLTPNFLNISMWAAQFFYLACLIPQILTNFKNKSGKGISELLLICYLNSYLFLLFYIFCLNLPNAYKIMAPLQTLATVILIFQRLYYDQNKRGKMWFMYTANIVIFLFLIPTAFKNPIFIGTLFGWCTFVFTIVNQLPQVFKIYQEKSVAGFSFLFVLFTGTAALIETSVAFIVHLPIQTCFMALKGILFFLIFSWQFRIYGKENGPDENSGP